MQTTQVFYHKNCNDGMGAAVSMYDIFHDEALYTSFSHNDPIIPSLEVGDLWFVDLCPNKTQLKDLLSFFAGTHRKVIVIDHHATSFDVITDAIKNGVRGIENLYYLLDNSESGATLASKLTDRIKYFHEEINLNGNVCLVSADLADRLKDGSETVTCKILTTDEPYMTNIDSDYMGDRNKNEFFDLLRVRDLWIDKDYNLKRKADCLSAILFHKGWAGRTVAEADAFYRDNSLADLLAQGEILHESSRSTAIYNVSRAHKTKIETNDLELAISFISSEPSLSGSYWCTEEQPLEPAIYVSVSVNHESNEIGLSVRSNALANALDLVEALKASNIGLGGGHLRSCGLRSKAMYDMSPAKIIETITTAARSIPTDG